jgi:tetratricopeptide (TPR) repeat protein
MKLYSRIGVFVLFNVLFILLISNGCSNKPETSEELRIEAIKLLESKNFPKALKKAQEAVKQAEIEYGSENPAMVEPLQILALIYTTQKDFLNAEPTYHRAIELIEKTGLQDSTESLKLMNNLASMYYFQKQYDKALSTYEKALNIANKNFPAEDPIIMSLQKGIEICKADRSGNQTNQLAEKDINLINIEKSDTLESIKTLAPAESGNSTDRLVDKEKNSETNIVDLVPESIKKAALENLSKQNISISNLLALKPVIIDDKGIVFPYKCNRIIEKNSIEVVLLFAAIKNKEKKDAYIFQEARIVSFNSYHAESEKGDESLKEAFKDIFPKLYS